MRPSREVQAPILTRIGPNLPLVLHGYVMLWCEAKRWTLLWNQLFCGLESLDAGATYLRIGWRRLMQLVRSMR